MSDNLKLSNQICFPLYTLAKEVIKQYRPILDELDLTYPQYLVMLVLWEEGPQSVSEIGNKLFLDSGTLTPLLKRLAQKNIITRQRNAEDERVVTISLTDNGRIMKEKARCVPDRIAETLNISTEDLVQLKNTIDKINTGINKNKEQ
ncbi:MarR family transcriptional regulator [uncultured Cyclobacterium sp.]|uniref:MarR family winged helix-turn-helix transcriptional regulator n=1 Tax=uncultured Cyclobacterium sp. TaxID=453820 RepID=UPI0030EE5C38|tara:strand:+ start:122222 stop:122662 length:441 start_codon:yes stop_codon:yes gene_type:complete